MKTPKISKSTRKFKYFRNSENLKKNFFFRFFNFQTLLSSLIQFFFFKIQIRIFFNFLIPKKKSIIAGLATAPVLYACEQYPELNEMLLRKFKKVGDAERAREIVVNSDGMDKTKRLIATYSEKAVQLVSNGVCTQIGIQ